MVSLIADQLQLQDGSCLLTSVPQTSVPATLVSAPQSTAALTTTAATKSTTAALTTTAGTTTLKTGAGVVAAHGAGGTILCILAIVVVAFGVNIAVRRYIK